LHASVLPAAVTSEVFHMKQKQKITGIKLDFNKMYYMSPNLLSPTKTLEYGMARLGQEVTHAWVDKQLTVAGVP
jgi:hypothetical protein